ncbi:hypothetical protein HN784_00105 [bacterium]|jgi:diadenosine tetraphosphate (Ap4A) HIT family hydrolase|nr:hypothetical protein [bacterium]MBT4251018.1 hypothetical protein [bacterium]MBT4597750.1 hypothetical protein [bacterium]MBT6753845.1 hypothetical protein [bacterium]MBT7037443.1 hypothetical protein [bacterium]
MTKYKEEEKRALMDFNHARTDEQKDLMEEIAQDGVCPFCQENFIKYHPKPILKENAHWFLTENMSPYKGTRIHFITVYKDKHVTMSNEIPSEHMGQMFELINWAIEKHKIEGGAILIRFGDSSCTGGSVDHFHAHLIIGNAKGTDEGAFKIKKKVGYMKAK